MSENIVILNDGYKLDLNKCLICKVCNYYYDKDGKIVRCSLCDSKIPILHYDKCAGEQLKKSEYFDECFFNCYDCSKYFCVSHITKDEFSVFSCCNDKSYYDNICEECFLNDKTKWRNVYKDHVLEYINKLKKENTILRAMIDYRPDGSGFVEAKEHFEGLAKK